LMGPPRGGTDGRDQLRVPDRLKEPDHRVELRQRRAHRHEAPFGRLYLDGLASISAVRLG